MGDEILSSEELDALLASVEEVGAGKRKREKRIIEYDFVRPNKLSGEQLRSLQRMHGFGVRPEEYSAMKSSTTSALKRSEKSHT